MLQMPEIGRKLDNLRQGSDTQAAINVTLGEYVKDYQGFSSVDDFLRIGLGIDTNETTLQSLSTMGDMPESMRWLRQEVFLDALRLGFDQPDIYNGLIARTIPVKGRFITTPFINISDAMPVKLGEGEKIPMGAVSFGQKTVGVYKYGRGYKITDEIKDLPINMMSIYLQDFGQQMNWGLNVEALRILVNGEQSDGSASVANVGIATAGTIAYTDLLLFKSRMARMHRTCTTWIMSENTMVSLFNVPEVKGYNGVTKLFNFTLSDLPIPKETNVIVTSIIPDGKILMVDPAKAMEKLDKQALRIETSRDASTQTEELYCSFQTAFSTLFRDARVQMDTTTTIGSAPFPAFLDPSVIEKQAFFARGAK